MILQLNGVPKPLPAFVPLYQGVIQTERQSQLYLFSDSLLDLVDVMSEWRTYVHQYPLTTDDPAEQLAIARTWLDA